MKISFNPVHPQNTAELRALESAKVVLNNVETILNDVRAQDQKAGVDCDFTSSDKVVLTNTDLAALVGRESATFSYPPGNTTHGFPTDPVYLAEKNLSAVCRGTGSLDAVGANHKFTKTFEDGSGWLGAIGLVNYRTVYEQVTPLPNNYARFDKLTQWADSGQWDFESIVHNRPQQLA